MAVNALDDVGVDQRHIQPGQTKRRTPLLAAQAFDLHECLPQRALQRFGECRISADLPLRQQRETRLGGELQYRLDRIADMHEMLVGLGLLDPGADTGPARHQAARLQFGQRRARGDAAHRIAPAQFGFARQQRAHRIGTGAYAAQQVVGHAGVLRRGAARRRRARHTTPKARRRAISAADTPAAANTSALCSPNAGAAALCGRPA